ACGEKEKDVPACGEKEKDVPACGEKEKDVPACGEKRTRISPPAGRRKRIRIRLRGEGNEDVPARAEKGKECADPGTGCGIPNPIALLDSCTWTTSIRCIEELRRCWSACRTMVPWCRRTSPRA